MNNQRKAVYSERLRVLKGIDLKKQVIDMVKDNDCRGLYNPDLPPEEWNIDQLISKVKEFVYLLEDLKADDVNLLSIEELKLSSRAVANSMI